MKAYREITPLNFDDVFVLIDSVDNGFDYPIHYHPEYELTLILGSAGNRIVGDSSETYQDNDLVLLGPFLQHKWDGTGVRCDKAPTPRVITLQFEPDLFAASLLQKQPFGEIRAMLDRSRRGIQFAEPTFAKAKEIMTAMTEVSGLESILKFLELLHVLAQSADQRYLASAFFDPQSTNGKQERIRIAYEYILENFLNQELRLRDVANQVNMSASAFSHFFKKSTNKSFKQFIIDLRLGYACKLLIETDLTISEIGYRCFNNLTNFNRLFKKYRSCTPYAFRQFYQEKNNFDWTTQKTLFQFLPPECADGGILRPTAYQTRLIHS